MAWPHSLYSRPASSYSLCFTVVFQCHTSTHILWFTVVFQCHTSTLSLSLYLLVERRENTFMSTLLTFSCCSFIFGSFEVLSQVWGQISKIEIYEVLLAQNVKGIQDKTKGYIITFGIQLIMHIIIGYKKRSSQTIFLKIDLYNSNKFKFLKIGLNRKLV